MGRHGKSVAQVCWACEEEEEEEEDFVIIILLWCQVDSLY